jgi:5-methylcytosine-specific restriction endonuclease McrA
MTTVQFMKKNPLATVIAFVIFAAMLLFPFIFLGLVVAVGVWEAIKYKSDENASLEKRRATKTTSTSTLFPSATRLSTEEYHNYLQSPEWKKKVSLIKQRDKVCQLTGATTQLEVHHITYDRLGNEDLSDLVLLSRSAHQSVHDYYGSYSRSNTYPIDNLKEII